jgi:alpha-tubulin suppressor-like RCC1 family protein
VGLGPRELRRRGPFQARAAAGGVLRGPIESVAIGGKFTVVARPDGSLWYWGTRPGFLAPSYDDNGRAAQAAYQPTLTPLCGTGGGQG